MSVLGQSIVELQLVRSGPQAMGDIWLQAPFVCISICSSTHASLHLPHHALKHPPVHLPIHASIYSTIYPSTIYIYIYISIHSPCIQFPIYPCSYLPIHSSFYPPVHSHIHLSFIHPIPSIHPSSYPSSICSSTHPFIHSANAVEAMWPGHVRGSRRE